MIKIPVNAEKIIENLNKNGYDAHIVGGCVRDLLLGLNPNDFDITTDALPNQIKSVFGKTADTGILHGTVTVIDESGIPFEVTTYRTESGYDDMRHPKNVSFVKSIKEDLSRRDFTVNALAFNYNDGIVDFFGGKKDIEKRILRAVGNPDVRFGEDALRILRLFRFASTLSFKIERKTKISALKLCKNLKSISAERVAAEISKAVMGDNVNALKPVIDNGGLISFGIKGCKSLKNIGKLPQNQDLRLFAFLMLCECDISATAEKLKLKNSLKSYFVKAKKILFLNSKSNDAEIKLALSLTSPDTVYDVISYKTHICGKNLSAIDKKTKIIIESAQPYKISHLKLNGDDIKSLGYKDKEIGEILEKLADEVRKNPDKNQKNELIRLINKSNI